MPARSVAVTFHNETDSALVLNGTSIPHGIWTVFPPARIKKDETVQFSSESDGVATGTEASATYQLEFLAATVNLYWDNPFVGSNTYRGTTSDKIWHKVISEGNGDGNNASIAWRLQETSSQRDGIPDDWKVNGVNIDDSSGTSTTIHVDLPTWVYSKSQLHFLHGLPLCFSMSKMSLPKQNHYDFLHTNPRASQNGRKCQQAKRICPTGLNG